MNHPFPFLATDTADCPASLLSRAQALPTPRVALVNAGSEVPLRGLREAVELELAEPVLIGDRTKIATAAEKISWDIRPYRLEHAPHAEASPRAAALARAGEVDSIMKGQVHTSTFLKGLMPSAAGLRDKGTRCGHVFHITKPGSDRPLFLTDAALNVDPDVATRKACLMHAIRLAEILGDTDIKAGILAPTEDPIPSVPNTMEAAEIAAWAKDALPNATVQGPMALDLIFSREAADLKNYASDVSGDADIMLVPNITSGNALFKLMVLGMGCCAGGLVMGLKVPVLLTSRSQKAPDRICSAALGAVVAAAS
ncbi:phosphate acyltransferase [Cognatiyoonia sp. IB215182]|uniref:phosphate acyltransferase n=1 Tax=Cognatiyoonia sp. IB215182 TaxID=3097353 RepID=UPI002A12F1E7|nr:phosphate acyltransferase [Cognatiyoonia sp. IB215182]MDX8353883.1 phosphate acyltransferase [Cognatiyoonia sp. IB215182]